MPGQSSVALSFPPRGRIGTRAAPRVRCAAGMPSASIDNTRIRRSIGSGA